MKPSPSRSTYMIVNVMLQNYMFGTVRWPWVSELYEYCQGVFLSKAIVSVLMNPRKPTFNVTAKGLTLDNDHLSELAWPFFAIYLMLLTRHDRRGASAMSSSPASAI